jgi:hypothetical protein
MGEVSWFALQYANLIGGVKKTTTNVNLAALSAAEGYLTLLWNLDPRVPSPFYSVSTAAKRSGEFCTFVPADTFMNIWQITNRILIVTGYFVEQELIASHLIGKVEKPRSGFSTFPLFFSPHATI